MIQQEVNEKIKQAQQNQLTQLNQKPETVLNQQNQKGAADHFSNHSFVYLFAFVFWGLVIYAFVRWRKNKKQQKLSAIKKAKLVKKRKEWEKSQKENKIIISINNI